MKTILLLSFSNLSRDPRVQRHALALGDSFRVVTAGYGGAPGFGHEHVEISPPKASGLVKKFLKALFLLLRIYAPVYWLDSDKRSAIQYLKDRKFDLILANDATSLPVAFSVCKEAIPVIVDMHEFAPGEQASGWKWDFFWKGYAVYLCKKYLRNAAHVVTVCDSIASLYQDSFVHDKPSVIMNCPAYIEAVPRAVGEKVRLIHHGAGCPSRKLELMAEMALLLDDRFTLEFMLVEADKHYCDWLKGKYASSKITFRDPVPMPVISRFLNENYDIGVYILEPEAVNSQYALPNKLFEFIQARLAVAVSPSHEMATVVRSTGAGVVAEDFTSASMARVINALDRERITSMKNASSTASQIYCSEAVYSDFKRLVDAVSS